MRSLKGEITKKDDKDINLWTISQLILLGFVVFTGVILTVLMVALMISGR